MAVCLELVQRFRVMRQLNDPVRNPDGNWTLYYSSPDEDDANGVRDDVQANDTFGDQYRVVDAGESTVIAREIY